MRNGGLEGSRPLRSADRGSGAGGGGGVFSTTPSIVAPSCSSTSFACAMSARRVRSASTTSSVPSATAAAMAAWRHGQHGRAVHHHDRELAAHPGEQPAQARQPRCVLAGSAQAAERHLGSPRAGPAAASVPARARRRRAGTAGGSRFRKEAASTSATRHHSGRAAAAASSRATVVVPSPCCADVTCSTTERWSSTSKATAASRAPSSGRGASTRYDRGVASTYGAFILRRSRVVGEGQRGRGGQRQRLADVLVHPYVQRGDVRPSAPSTTSSGRTRTFCVRSSPLSALVRSTEKICCVPSASVRRMIDLATPRRRQEAAARGDDLQHPPLAARELQVAGPLHLPAHEHLEAAERAQVEREERPAQHIVLPVQPVERVLQRQHRLAARGHRLLDAGHVDGAVRCHDQHGAVIGVEDMVHLHLVAGLQAVGSGGLRLLRLQHRGERRAMRQDRAAPGQQPGQHQRQMPQCCAERRLSGQTLTSRYPGNAGCPPGPRRRRRGPAPGAPAWHGRAGR